MRIKTILHLTFKYYNLIYLNINIWIECNKIKVVINNKYQILVLNNLLNLTKIFKFKK
jgi:hypothetical protein